MAFDDTKLLSLSGHRIDSAAANKLSQQLAVPEQWLSWMVSYPIADAEISLSEQDDLSGLGVEIMFMDDKDILVEAKECYPGLVSTNQGYIPFGACALGSGDPYFFRLADGAVVRIPHDSAVDLETNTLIDSAVELVAHSIHDLLDKATILQRPQTQG